MGSPGYGNDERLPLMKRIFLLAPLLGTLLLLGACGNPMAPSPPPESLPATDAPQSSPGSTVFPTAAPLFTPTPGPISNGSSQATSVATAGAGTDSVAAIVNGTIISTEDYEARLAQAKIHFLKAPGVDVATKDGEKALQHLEAQVLDWMIDQVLIEEAASAQGITISDAQVDAQVAQMKGQDAARFEKWLDANGLTEASIRQQVRIDLTTAAVRDSVTASLPREEMQVHVRHILLSEESTANSVLQKLKAGQDFASVARQFSEDETTRGGGGDVGFIPKGVMPPSFERAAFALQAGQISDVIRTMSGYHIVQVIEIDPKRPVADEFWPIVQERAFENWLAAQRAKADTQSR